MRILGGILGCLLVVGLGAQVVKGQIPTSGCSTCSGSGNAGLATHSGFACSGPSYGQLKPSCAKPSDWRRQNVWDGYLEERMNQSSTPVEDVVLRFRSHVDQFRARFRGVENQGLIYGAPPTGYQVISDQPISTGCGGGNCGGTTSYPSNAPIKTIEEGTLSEPIEAPKLPAEPIEVPKLPTEPTETLPMPEPQSSTAMLWK